jgi:uncharacterized protein (TIGR00269 family)
VVQRKISGEFHCLECFIESVEKLIYQTVVHYRMLKPEDMIIVGLSGGKDSISLLYNMIHIKEKIGNFAPIIALTIDEGIRDYRKKSIEFAKQYCQEYNIHHEIVSFKERIGKNLDEILVLKRGTDTERYTCNYCATIRRRLLNEEAKKLGGTVLALGHNLTDVTETFLMNVLYKRHQLIANQYLFKTETEEAKKHFIKKITPLIKIPEEEIFLYANLKHLKYYPSHCPYREEDPILRKRVLDFILKIKTILPEVEYNLFESFQRMSETLYKTLPYQQFQECNICGYPCGNSQLCTYCTLIESLKN